MPYRVIKSVSVIGLVTLGLSACGGGSTGTSNSAYTASGFTSPEANGAITHTIETTYQYDVETSGTGNGGYAYITGFESEKMVAFAGVNSGTSLGATPVSGTAIMSGSYEAGFIDSITRNGNYLNGNSGVQGSAITLTANFGANSLTGTSNDGYLSVNGNISGSSLSGSVSFDGTAGSLNGVIGADEAIGAFHGNGTWNGSGYQTYAGGFIVCTSGTGC